MASSESPWWPDGALFGGALAKPGRNPVTKRRNAAEVFVSRLARGRSLPGDAGFPEAEPGPAYAGSAGLLHRPRKRLPRTDGARDGHSQGHRVNLLSLGVMARSLKENERRLPLHPRHLHRIPDGLRESVYLEHGYGDRFGMSDDRLKGWVAGFRTREAARRAVRRAPATQATAQRPCRDASRPGLLGVAALRPDEHSRLAIDQRLTLIAFEAMNHWNSDGSFNLHVFHKNNEAGYCSVLHAMQIEGSTGDYGRRLRAVVIGFGATARGCGDGAQRAGRP